MQKMHVRKTYVCVHMQVTHAHACTFTSMRKYIATLLHCCWTLDIQYIWCTFNVHTAYSYNLMHMYIYVHISKGIYIYIYILACMHACMHACMLHTYMTLHYMHYILYITLHALHTLHTSHALHTLYTLPYITIHYHTLPYITKHSRT